MYRRLEEFIAGGGGAGVQDLEAKLDVKMGMMATKGGVV